MRVYFARALADTYFASTEKPEDLVSRVAGRVEECASDFDFSYCQNAFEHLYGETLRLGSQSRATRHGDEGELLKVRINRAKALRESLVGLWLNAPLTWRSMARNQDAEQRQACQGANALMEFAWKNDGLSVFCGEWAKAAVAYRAAYAFPEWNAGGGEQVMGDPATGQVFFEGSLRARLVMPWDVFFDCEYRSWEELPWVCVRTWENKHDLAALAPEEQRESILNASGDWAKKFQRVATKQQKRDVVGLFHFFHRPTPAAPQGVYLRFLDGKTALGQAEPLKRIPVIRFTPSSREDSPHGDTAWESTLGIQEVTDSVNSSLATNFDAFGTQFVSVPAADALDYDSDLGMVVQRRQGSEKAEGVNLTKNPEGAEDWLQRMDSAQLDVVGLNDVSQGSPDTAQMNAQAFLVLRSAATERNATPQKRLLMAIGQLGLESLRLMAENMPESQYLEIAGRTSKLLPQKMGKSALASITGLYVDVGNALEQSPAGRLQLFQMYQESYAQAGKQFPVEEIQQVVETGRIEQVLAPERDESILIEWENAQIAAGTTPTVHGRQDHIRHVRGHRCNAVNPAILADAAALKADQQHFDWHYREFWGLPEGAVPMSDPQYFDRVRVMLGQQAPGQIGPPPMGSPGASGPPQPGEQSGTPPPSPGSAPSQSQPPSDSSVGAPPALVQPTGEQPPGQEVQPVPSILPS